MLGRGLIIAVSGVDGSGKTTQIGLLEKRVKQLRPETITVWSRWRPISSLLLLALAKRLGYATVHATSSIGFVETQLSSKAGLASLWCFLTMLDNLLKTGLKVSIPLLLGRVVICDRYVLDLIVETMADLHDSPWKPRLGYKLLRLLPRPDQAFLINVDPEIAYGRKPDLPTLSHFVERVHLYNEMGRILGVQIIDGRLQVEEIHALIWNIVSRTVQP